MTARVEGVAAQHPPGSQEPTFDDPVFINCSISVMRTRRIKTAGIPRKSPGEGQLIAPDQGQERQPGQVADGQRQVFQGKITLVGGI